VAIDDFLAQTAAWTPRWFNKPKFHVLLHLPSHIRRFGPAILFATEGFESFNAVIRAKSIHSNRQAPSRDIAIAFAHAERVRYLTSGAFIFLKENDTEDYSPTDFSKRCMVGRGPQMTLRDHLIATCLSANSSPPPPVGRPSFLL
jgi:hypothetical protein